MATMRNHYDLKEIEKSYEQKQIQRESQEMERNLILEEHKNKIQYGRWPAILQEEKYTCYFGQGSTTEILYTTFTKGQVIPLILKQC